MSWNPIIMHLMDLLLSKWWISCALLEYIFMKKVQWIHICCLNCDLESNFALLESNFAFLKYDFGSFRTEYYTSQTLILHYGNTNFDLYPKMFATK